MVYLGSSFVGGSNLANLEEDFVTFSAEMKRMGVAVPWALTRGIWQLSRNIMGKSENTVVLNGDIMNEEEESKLFHFMAVFITRLKASACMFFGEYEPGATLVLENGGLKFLQTETPGTNYGSDYLSFGVNCFAMARKTKQRKYSREATLLRNKC